LNIPEELLRDPVLFRDQAGKRLGAPQTEFVEQMDFIREKRAQGKKWSASGVLVPLEFDSDRGEQVVVLNKRSSHVQQPGDLCFPGGRADRKPDKLLARFLSLGVLPSTRTEFFRLLLHAEKRVRDIHLFLFASSLRESWEEMRLKPWNVDYLGALPTHALPNFSRIMFPLAGRIRRRWRPRPNWEVGKIIRLPLRAFYQPENYALCEMILPAAGREKFGVDSWEVPCLVIPDGETEEVLWGATFRILLTFIERTLELPVSRINPVRRLSRQLPEHYYSGRSRTPRCT